MESDILVDSNVYIKLLASRKDPVRLLGEWADLQGGFLVTCGIVRLEVLRGMKFGQGRNRLVEFMEVMVSVPSDNRFWLEATDLAWTLDRKGHVIPSADVMIAASAKRAEASILTFDRHFDRIDGLRVITPPAEWFL